MHIDPTDHEHGTSAKVYTYEGDFDVTDEAINWNAAISQGGKLRGTISGAIPMSSPALGVVAESAVRDEILKGIDAFEDRSSRTQQLS